MITVPGHTPMLETYQRGSKYHADITCECDAMFTATFSDPDTARKTAEKALDWHLQIEAKAAVEAPSSPTDEPLDLDAVMARYRLAQLAGEDATDGERGWDDRKIAALIRSWWDVAKLHDEVKKLREDRTLRGTANIYIDGLASNHLFRNIYLGD